MRYFSSADGTFILFSFSRKVPSIPFYLARPKDASPTEALFHEPRSIFHFFSLCIQKERTLIRLCRALWAANNIKKSLSWGIEAIHCFFFSSFIRCSFVWCFTYITVNMNNEIDNRILFRGVLRWLIYKTIIVIIMIMKWNEKW